MNKRAFEIITINLYDTSLIELDYKLISLAYLLLCLGYYQIYKRLNLKYNIYIIYYAPCIINLFPAYNIIIFSLYLENSEVIDYVRGLSGCRLTMVIKIMSAY